MARPEHIISWPTNSNPNLIALTLAMAFAAPVLAADVTRSKGIERWLARQTDLTAWSAELTQTRQLKSLAQPLVTPGRVWFKAPNLFRWELGKPAKTVAIREPDRLVLLYPLLRRAEVYSLSQDDQGPWHDSLTLLEAGFPREQDQLERQFRILSTEQMDSNTVVSLEPKSSAARRWVDRVNITLDTESFDLLSTVLEFADGSRLRNDFRNSEVNPEIPPDLLKATIPADYVVTELPK